MEGEDWSLEVGREGEGGSIACAVTDVVGIKHGDCSESSLLASPSSKMENHENEKLLPQDKDLYEKNEQLEANRRSPLGNTIHIYPLQLGRILRHQL